MDVFWDTVYIAGLSVVVFRGSSIFSVSWFGHAFKEKNCTNGLMYGYRGSVVAARQCNR